MTITWKAVLIWPQLSELLPPTVRRVEASIDSCLRCEVSLHRHAPDQFGLAYATHQTDPETVHLQRNSVCGKTLCDFDSSLKNRFCGDNLSTDCPDVALTK